MKKSTKDKYEPYVKLDHYMMDSAAWTSLSDSALWLYIELRKQFNFRKGGNLHLELPYSKVAWRMSRGTHSKKMQELSRYGFIRVLEPGGLPRRPTVYALSREWVDVSKKIVDKEGREAIRLKKAKNPRSKDNLRNLIGHRSWDDEESI